MGRAEGYIAVEPEARKECHREDQRKREDMGRDDHKAQVQKALGHDKVIDNEVPQRIKRRGSSTTDSIAENLKGDNPP